MSHLLKPESALETMRALISGRKGLDAADIFVQKLSTLKAVQNDGHSLYSGKLETAILSLRLFNNCQSYTASTTSLDMDSLKSLLMESEKELSKLSPREDRNLPVQIDDIPEKTYSGIDKTFQLVPFDEKLSRMAKLHEGMNKFKSGSESISTRTEYTEVIGEEWIASMDSSRYLNNSFSHACVELLSRLPSKDGLLRIRRRYTESQYYKLPWTNALAPITRAVELMGQIKSIKGGTYGVILTAPVVAKILQSLSQSFFADRILDNRSFIKSNDVGQELFSTHLNFFDDPHQESRALGHRPWDHEGSATAKKALILGGKVTEFLHNRWSAKKMGLKNNFGGNAYKQQAHESPDIRAYSLVLEAGRLDHVDMLRNLESGLVIYAVDPIDSYCPQSGALLMRASGAFVNAGEEKYAFSHAVVHSNIRDLLGHVQAVGRDIYVRGDVSTPSLLVNPVTIIGNS